MYGLNWDGSAVAQSATQPKFKVGDRVRVVKDGAGGSWHNAEIGSVGTIVHSDDYHYQRDDDWYFHADELAPAFLPGDRVRVTKHAGYFAVGDEGEVESQADSTVFVKHGAYQRIGLPIDADALELIAEPEAGNKGQPKYYDEYWKLKSLDGLLESGSGGITIRDPQPCIVARVLDGTPRPSNVPFVHTSVAAATTEAERLARNNPGQEFAVYQRVAGRVAEVSYEMKEVA